MRYPLKTALTVAIALAQIGEFSFILSEEAMKLKLLPDEGYDIIVACALISIAINPLLFSLVDGLTQYFQKKHSESLQKATIPNNELPRAIIVGFGPIGKQVCNILESAGFSPTIIDSNVDTVTTLKEHGKHALYGDASVPNILQIVHIENASLLIITVPEIKSTTSMIQSARQLHPKIPIIARASFISEKRLLENLDVSVICSEEESSKAFDAEVINTLENM
jgi:CPA2 family monovalent cation:H+ antiporter-2